MKLSAPPPPPPEPNDPDPNPPADAGPPPPADAPAGPPGTDAPAAAPKPVAWPAWFAGADVLLALLAVTLAFLAASFAARNADVWLHLGAGRLLTTGEYSLGSDPLSYAAADRPWVNHSWLWDLGTFLVYRSDETGFTLVLLKALAVAGGFGLLMAIRRPGASLWPWAVTAAVAAVAAGPRLGLTPLTGSVVLFCATLFVLLRVPSRPGSWRTPLLIGAIFWVWANVDAWFVVGPFAVALLLLGELIRGTPFGDVTRTPGYRSLTRLGDLVRGTTQTTAEATDEAADPLGVPDAGTLARALAVGVVACMLNPHHVRVWDLPFELVGGGGVESDTRLAGLLHRPLTGAYWTNYQQGYNLNGVAYAALLLAGLYAAFLSGAVGRLAGRPWDVDPAPLPHAALWFGLAAVSVLSVYAVPFLAVVTVPLVASRLNLVGDGVRLADRDDKAARLVLTGAAAGRGAAGLALAGLCLAAWPGWLHPPASYWGALGPTEVYDPASARRVAWAVEPDPELVRAASWLGEQRRAGRLPADARGVVAAVELANYCAYFAPEEKVLANGRYAHHRPELPDLIAARAAAEFRPGSEPKADPDRVGRVLDARGASYVVVYERNRQTSSLAGFRRLGLGVPGVLEVFGAVDRWSPWYTDGRAAAFGWRPGPGAGRPEWDALRVPAGVLAFGPGVEPLPPGPVQPPPPPRVGLLDEFVAGPVAPAPAGADAALGWMEYKAALVQRETISQQAAKLLQLNVPGTAAAPLAAAVEQFRNEFGSRQGAFYPRPPADGGFLAAAVLALRSARRAVADNPDHPDGYFALARALNDPDLPLTPSEREVGRAAAYRQALDRFPPAGEFRRGLYAGSPTLAAAELAGVLLGRQIGPAEFSGISLDLAGVRDLVGEVVLARNNKIFRASYAMATRSGGIAADAQLVDRPVLYAPDVAVGVLRQALDYAAAEFGASPPPEVQDRLRALDEVRKALESRVGQASDRFLANAERAPRVRDKYQLARNAGLPGRALGLLKELKGDELGQEFGPEAPQAALEMVALEIGLGRLEDAAADLAALRAELGALAAASPPPPRIDQYLEVARLQQYHILWLRGSYADAGRALDEIDGRTVGRPTPFPPPDQAVGLNLPFVFPFAAAFGGVNQAADFAFWAVQRQVAFLTVRGLIRAEMDGAAQFYFRRGVWALLDGDPAGAKEFFALTRREPPAGWDLPPAGATVAREYVRYIEAAQKAAGK